MASEGGWTRVGSATDAEGRKIWAWRKPGGMVSILGFADTRFDEAGLAEFRELLDRAAMPGQPAPGEAPAAGARGDG